MEINNLVLSAIMTAFIFLAYYFGKFSAHFNTYRLIRKEMISLYEELVSYKKMPEDDEQKRKNMKRMDEIIIISDVYNKIAGKLWK